MRRGRFTEDQIIGVLREDEAVVKTADANGRPLSFFMTAGQISDYTAAAALLDDLPKAQWLLGDHGYDAD